MGSNCICKLIQVVEIYTPDMFLILQYIFSIDSIDSWIFFINQK